MRPVMPWFLPIGLWVAWLGFRTSRGLATREGRRGEAFLLLTLTGFPLLVWLFLQCVPSAAARP